MRCFHSFIIPCSLLLVQYLHLKQELKKISNKEQGIMNLE